MRSASDPKPKRFLISGASGLVGTQLSDFLSAKGHKIFSLVRSRDRLDSTSIFWEPLNPSPVDRVLLEGFDGFIHLAGENVASGRWNSKLKDKIEGSRVLPTRYLAEAFSRCERPPAVFISASAVGIYGNRGDEMLSEDSNLGEGFLAEVCKKWERSLDPAKNAGIRTHPLRFGMILSSKGGVLKKILPFFKCGLGGRLGSGRQFMSWVSIRDVIHVIEYLLNHDVSSGPLNVASGSPIRNSDFTGTLARTLGRPVGPPVPAFVLRIFFGEMADELLLSSTRVFSKRLNEIGFEFQDSNLEGSFSRCL